MTKQIVRSRQLAYHRQGGLCFYCQQLMLLGQVSGRLARLQCTAEHLQAKCDGGADTAKNIAAACAHCNRTRHKLPTPLAAEAFRVYVMRRVTQRRWHPAWVYERRSGMT